ncbi:hypothetical protein N8I84_25430 [Streptomyces cynarae]|uniref:Flp family type IVb pilin n=1 Tax=Streptomyces cynarae TaxID=2981134 RepID=A0ABY6EEP8_9ACTN|nr:hypothetical protein [Streptomyces cynarae]UXY24647.1 hypothetical protein N8I84_25430 [Streptomyces cynarae]
MSRIRRGVGTWGRTVVARMRGAGRDAGAGFVEYAGLMIIVAAIFTMVHGLGLDNIISQAILRAVNNVTGG